LEQLGYVCLALLVRYDVAFFYYVFCWLCWGGRGEGQDEREGEEGVELHVGGLVYCCWRWVTERRQVEFLEGLRECGCRGGRV